MTDLGGRFLQVDDQFCQLLQRERQHILGRTILELTAEHDRPLNAEKLDLLRESGSPFLIRKTYLLETGRLQPVENSVSLTTNGLDGMVVVASVRPRADNPGAGVDAMVRVATAQLNEQKMRASLGHDFADPNYGVLLAAYIAEAEGSPGWARDLSEMAGGDPKGNLLSLWRLVDTGALIVDGRASSVEEASLRVSLEHTKLLQEHLAGLSDR